MLELMFFVGEENGFLSFRGFYVQIGVRFCKKSKRTTTEVITSDSAS